MFDLRPYQETDEEAVKRIGAVAAEERDCAALRLVAGEPIAGHVQIVDRSTTPIRRQGVCDMYLIVAPQRRRQGMGSALYQAAMSFAQARQARRVKTWFDSADEDATAFYSRRGWVEIEREYPSTLDVRAFDPSRFRSAIERVERQGVRLLTYAEAGDTPEHRRKLYDLVTAAREHSPWQESAPDVQEPFESWAESMEKWPAETLLIAEVDGRWVGVTTRPDWPYTGVLLEYRGRGIATALKARQIALHQAAGGEVIETENHANNAPMLAVNRKLGYVFGSPSVTYQKVLER
jgi:mycothiol synthase